LTAKILKNIDSADFYDFFNRNYAIKSHNGLLAHHFVHSIGRADFVGGFD
jgi:hypothetical protein